MNLLSFQHWLYGGIATGLGDVAAGDAWAIFAAMAAAVVFGAIHALMPGHGKTVLVSYHLGQPAKLTQGVTNGAIVALTNVGLALVLVLAGFAIISRAFAYGGRMPPSISTLDVDHTLRSDLLRDRRPLAEIEGVGIRLHSRAQNAQACPASSRDC